MTNCCWLRRLAASMRAAWNGSRSGKKGWMVKMEGKEAVKRMDGEEVVKKGWND
jgi:hypothetical protein